MSAVFAIFVFALCRLDFLFHFVKQKKRKPTKQRPFLFSLLNQKTKNKNRNKTSTLGRKMISKHYHLKTAEKDIG